MQSVPAPSPRNIGRYPVPRLLVHPQTAINNDRSQDMRSEFGGMGITDATRLKALKAEKRPAEEARGSVDALTRRHRRYGRR
jgi:hypothetical protein